MPHQLVTSAAGRRPARELDPTGTWPPGAEPSRPSPRRPDLGRHGAPHRRRNVELATATVASSLNLEGDGVREPVALLGNESGPKGCPPVRCHELPRQRSCRQETAEVAPDRPLPRAARLSTDGGKAMAAQKQPPAEEPSPHLDEHALVKALVPDPSQGPPNATVLQGFLGKSPTNGVWRLYLSSALDEYVEIPEEDILHTQELPDGQGTLVWVPKSLNLQHVKTQSQQVQAEFLSGSIAAGRLAAGAPSPLPLGVIPRPTPPIVASVHMICPTPSAVHQCGITLPFCPSEAMINCGHTALAACHSQAPVFCVP